MNQAARIKALEARQGRPKRYHFLITRAGRADDDVVGAIADSASVERIPGETVEAMCERLPQGPPFLLAFALYR